jgi:hypothetical protein
MMAEKDACSQDVYQTLVKFSDYHALLTKRRIASAGGLLPIWNVYPG